MDLQNNILTTYRLSSGISTSSHRTSVSVKQWVYVNQGDSKQQTLRPAGINPEFP